VSVDRKFTGSNFGCTLRCAFLSHSFSQSSSDGTVTSAFAMATAGQVGVFRAGMMHRLGIVPQRLLCEPLKLPDYLFDFISQFPESLELVDQRPTADAQ